MEFNYRAGQILTQHCKRFATASTSSQVAVLSWRYVAYIDGPANSSASYGGRRL